jgi:putative ABC transport system permease protein
MNIWDNLRISLRSLQSNKLRTTLTLLGVVIGVAAVIAMLSIGRGAQAGIDAQITAMGSNLLFVRAGAATQGGVRQDTGSIQTLTYEDAKALADPANVPSAAAVSPEGQTGGQAVYGSQNTRTRIIGAVPDYAIVHDATVADGDFVDAAHLAGYSKVAVLGATTATNLFGAGGEAVGQTIRIMNQPFQVIGVLKAKGGTGFGNQDDMVIIPLTTLQQRLAVQFRFRGAQGVEGITVKVISKDVIPQATTEIQNVLRERHHIVLDDDFTIQNQQSILDQATQITGALTLFLGGVAAISLLVGGMGIMNIMLVSVTERTREIGIRKAVGARRSDIQFQFLTESVVLSIAGGILGILVGVGISALMGRVSLGAMSIKPVVQIDSILLATGFSAFVGIFFGFYPASRAASLHPIDALHYE